MYSNPVELLLPVFDFLNGIVRDYGDILFILFVFAAIPFLIWVLSGGLRRKLYRGGPAPHVRAGIAVHLPIGRPTSAPEQLEPFPPHQDPPDYGRD